MAAKKAKKAGKKRGPKEQRLKIEGDWEAAVAQALKKAPPPAKNRKKGRE